MKVSKFFMGVIASSLLLTITGCSGAKNNNSVGNSVSNLTSGGYMAEKGDYIFFSRGKELLKSKIGSKESESILIGDVPEEINVVGDWIYYNVHPGVYQKSGTYKVKIDGNEKLLLTSDFYQDMVVVDNWIYYDGGDDSGFYKVKTDGTEKEKISDNKPSNINIVDNVIYYRSNLRELYKVNIDGTEEECIRSYKQKDYSDGYKIDNVLVYKDYIYFSDKDGIHKVNIEDKKENVVGEASECNYINIIEDWIYYSSYDNLDDDKMVLYKMELDGKGKEKVIEYDRQEDTIIHLTSKYIYIKNEKFRKSDIITRMDINGEGKTIIE